jgi:hypothetical protein
LNIDEVEPNDSPASAQNIGGGNAVVQGTSRISDPGAPLGHDEDVEDWYSFTLTSQAPIEIDLTGFLSNVDLDVGLCVVDGNCNFGSGLAAGENSEGVPEHIAITLGPGTYAIGISAIDPTTAPDMTSYTLTVTGGQNPLPTDLSIAVTGAVLPVVSGARTNLMLAVTNAGPNPAAATVTGTTPSGTILREIMVADGSADVDPDGTFTATLGSIPAGGSVTIGLGLEVTAEAGTTLTGSASVEAGSQDTNPADNTETLIVAVIEGTIVDVTFEPPAGNELDPPRNLTATIRASAIGNADVQRTPGSQATGYNVYRSKTPNVAPTPENLFSTLPPTQTTVSVGAETGGSFFVVTATYPQGESAPSNEAGVEVMGATLGTVKASKTKITITGSGFTPTVQVFLDGIPFASPSRIKKNRTRVVQKGRLLTGQSLEQYLTSGRAVTISVLDANGGLSQISFVAL